MAMQQTQPPYLPIQINRPPRRFHNVYQMLIFEWVLYLYYCYMFASALQQPHNQLRMLTYCMLFLLFDKLDLTHKYCQLQDPLHLSPTINCLRYLSYLTIIDISLLLVRLVIEQQNLHACIVVVHFLVFIAMFLNQFSKRGTKLDINVDSNSVLSKFVTPLAMFIFNRTAEPQQDFWYLEFTIFAINLFISSELNRVLLMKECQYFGWLGLENKEKASWSKRRALRMMIVVCCVLIVVQNLLLIFDKIKYQISVTIVHSFIVSIVAYLLYIGYLPIKK